MFDILQKTLTGYEIIPIGPDNYADAWDVYATNHDFFMLTGDKPASKEGILASLHQVPNGFDLSGKCFVMLKQNGRVVAVTDLFAGYPTGDCLWLGLLLIHGDMQGRSVGSTIVKGIIDAGHTCGFTSIKLGVIDANAKAAQFWQSLGFVQTGTSGNILVFSRSIDENTN